LREIVTHRFVSSSSASFGLGGQSNNGEKITAAVWFHVFCFFEADFILQVRNTRTY
jgi:hypothetical protein